MIEYTLLLGGMVQIAATIVHMLVPEVKILLIFNFQSRLALRIVCYLGLIV